jgi:hypothetical protein
MRLRNPGSEPHGIQKELNQSHSGTHLTTCKGLFTLGNQAMLNESDHQYS